MSFMIINCLIIMRFYLKKKYKYKIHLTIISNHLISRRYECCIYDTKSKLQD